MLISLHKFENTSLEMELPLCICTVRPKVFGYQVPLTRSTRELRQYSLSHL